jgi:hypothetical protein
MTESDKEPLPTGYKDPKTLEIEINKIYYVCFWIRGQYDCAAAKWNGTNWERKINNDFTPFQKCDVDPVGVYST